MSVLKRNCFQIITIYFQTYLPPPPVPRKTTHLTTNYIILLIRDDNVISARGSYSVIRIPYQGGGLCIHSVDQLRAGQDKLGQTQLKLELELGFCQAQFQLASLVTS